MEEKMETIEFIAIIVAVVLIFGIYALCSIKSESKEHVEYDTCDHRMTVAITNFLDDLYNYDPNTYMDVITEWDSLQELQQYECHGCN